MVNKNNDPKAHCMYTTKYTSDISGGKTVDISSIQPKVQVLTRVPNPFNEVMLDEAH